MKAVIQRVTSASVTVDGSVCGKIGNGFLVLLGVCPDDDEKTAQKLAEKIARLRVFCDENGKMKTVSDWKFEADTKLNEHRQVKISKNK